MTELIEQILDESHVVILNNYEINNNDENHQSNNNQDNDSSGNSNENGDDAATGPDAENEGGSAQENRAVPEPSRRSTDVQDVEERGRDTSPGADVEDSEVDPLPGPSRKRKRKTRFDECPVSHTRSSTEDSEEDLLLGPPRKRRREDVNTVVEPVGASSKEFKEDPLPDSLRERTTLQDEEGESSSGSKEARQYCEFLDSNSDTLRSDEQVAQETKDGVGQHVDESDPRPGGPRKRTRKKR